MKQSPRAWLLARHQAAAPSLDSIRHAALETALRDNAPVPISQLLPALFLPNRRLWTALAAAWILLLSLHFAHTSSSAPVTSDSPQLAATPDNTRPHRVATSTSFADRQAQLHALFR